MSVEISVILPGEPAYVVPFATNHGIEEFTDWVLTLPDEDYPQLADFAEEGWTQGLDCVHDQIRVALLRYPPDSADVLSVAMHLESLTESEHPDGIVLLGDAGRVAGQDADDPAD